MTQKNKIFSITLLLLILGSVACRKSGGGGPTQTDPIKNLTGNLLIVSTDGKTNLNSLPLSFVGASATVTEVTEEQQKLNLDPTNFIVENNALKLTKFDLSKADAAVSNKITLTFSLSGENLSRYTDTADIFVGKYSNIYTNTFDAFTNIGGKSGKAGEGILNADIGNVGNGITFKFDDDTKTYFNTNTFYITNENANSDANVPVKGFAKALEDKLKNNDIIKTYFNVDSIKVTAPTITDTADKQAVFKVDLTPKSALFETPYKSYDFIIDPKGKWLTDK